jgi:hypothetical protein
MVASAATAFMVPTGVSRALLEVLPLVDLVAEVEALRLPNFQTCRGHPRQEHEAVVPPPKRHAHNLLPHLRQQPILHLSMLMTIPSVLQRIYG